MMWRGNIHSISDVKL